MGTADVAVECSSLYDDDAVAGFDSCGLIGWVGVVVSAGVY